MPELTPSERRALTLATGLAVMGAALRLGLGPGPEAWSWRPVDGAETPAKGASGDGRLDSVRAGVARSLRRERRASRPLAPGERLDPNRVDEAELRRLPGVGPVTARAVVRDRRENGPFGHPEALLRVPGIGPATLEKIRPHLGLPVRTGETPSDDPRLDLNRATETELEALPGIGPYVARQIVRSRRREGPFRAVDELIEVPGVGPVRLEGVRDLVRVGPP